MRLWLTRNSTVPIREQLVTQVVLGILCNELAPGERLPSTRELARRFHVHSNTISAAYRQLEHEGWVASLRGSGVYVQAAQLDRPPHANLALDGLIAQLFRAARELGAPLSTLRARLQHWLTLQPPDHFLLIEPDENLRQIVMVEMQTSLNFPVKSCEIEECGQPERLFGAVPVVLPSKSAAVRNSIAPDTDVLVLQVNSIPASLATWLPVPNDQLIAVVSRWTGFLKSARTMLAAAGVSPDALLLRDARKSGWQRGLKQAAAIVCDSAIAADLSKQSAPLIVFPVLSPASLVELKHYEEFVLGAASRPL